MDGDQVLVVNAKQITDGEVSSFQVFDYEQNGRHRLLGETEVTALRLQQLAGARLTESR